MLNIKKGQLLISEPSLSDPIFFKSVVLITHHTASESVGLILNQATKTDLDQIIDDIPSNNFPIYIGGPVQKNAIHFIHTLGDMIPNTQEIIEGLYWGGDFDQVLRLMTEDKIAKNHIRFFAGYSGWGKDQLNHEIKKDGWITHEPNINLCMQNSTEKLWSDLIKTKSKKYAIWANIPKDPSLN